ncbi:hypothetical protein ACFWWM_42230 [Streptomyces sp. NPDC058682]|uniref:hypothetical protein n=1 Tax=unclassified Streptomyces TaxID=2593676 RepID=UPI0022557BD8|nr:hypothetical protein [Streptomyces sp. NBC_01214]MCX4803074.1 hypothetical protein [Streptomyces sp. NBC_01214]
MSETLESAQGRQSGGRGTRAGYWGFGLAVGYAVFVRFYQGAGGMIGVPGTSKPETLPSWYMANYVAGLVILLGGVACLFLTQSRVRTIPRWSPLLPGEQIPRPLMLVACLSPVLLGGIFSVTHGVAGGFTHLLELCGAIEIDYPDEWETLNVTSMNLWNILFYEPWFIAMGICLLGSALQYLRDTGSTEAAVDRVNRVSIALIGVLTIASSLSVIMGWNVEIG